MVVAPERGDLIWLSFTPQQGTEQAGRRPALDLSPSVYNRRVGRALVCPITSKVKGCPFEVVLPNQGTVRGVVLTDQLRSLDWRARQAERIEKTPPDVVDQAVKLIGTLLTS